MMHVSLVALLVDDYDTAIDFFVGAVGFELIEDSPSLANDGTPKRWVVVAPSGGQTQILLAEARGERQSAAVGNQFSGRVGYFLTVDDFDAHYQKMVAAGVEFISEPRDEAYGWVVVWRDIAGNLWDLLGPNPVA